jgi:hypothetical protein
MRNLYVSIEYPVQPQAFPSIWVDFENTGSLQIAGIAHTEVMETDEAITEVTRWRFSGYASFTVVALSSLERDRMYDELVRTMAFANRDAAQISEFREHIEHNEFVAMNMDFDQIESRGNAASPGTPWGTDEIIYERTINMELIGEFVSDGSTHTLVPLSRIIVEGTNLADGQDYEPIPDYEGVSSGDVYDPTAWH